MIIKRKRKASTKLVEAFKLWNGQISQTWYTNLRKRKIRYEKV